MKRRTVWIVAAVAVLTLAAVLALLLVPRGGTAEQQAIAYLQALENGDLAAVEAVGVDVPAETAATFPAATAHISDVAVVASVESESTATVHAVYTLAGEQRDAEITMRLEGGRWVPDLKSALGTAETDSPAAIGDVLLAAGAETALLPAQYDVQAAPAQFLEGIAVIQIGPGDVQEVTVSATLTAEATTLAQRQLDGYLDSCTQPSSEVVASCGISIPWAADFSALSDVSYRIEQHPTLSLTPTSFQAHDGVLVATVTGTGLEDGSAKTLSYRTADWTVRGDVTFTAEDIVLSVW